MLLLQGAESPSASEEEIRQLFLEFEASKFALIGQPVDKRSEANALDDSGDLDGFAERTHGRCFYHTGSREKVLATGGHFRNYLSQAQLCSPWHTFGHFEIASPICRWPAGRFSLTNESANWANRGNWHPALFALTNCCDFQRTGCVIPLMHNSFLYRQGWIARQFCLREKLPSCCDL